MISASALADEQPQPRGRPDNPVDPARPVGIVQRPDSVADRWVEVNRRVEAVCAEIDTDPAGITVVAVSKMVDVASVRAAYNAGVRNFGENYASELISKAALFPDATWHFIGRLQRNKINALASHAAVFHSIEKQTTVDALSARIPGAEVFVQVNLARESQKGGCEPANVAALVKHCQNNGLNVLGLMTVPPANADPSPWFGQLRAMADKLSLVGCSMGMSDDFEAALRAGATTIRIGRAIFGPRTTSDRSTPAITRS